VKKKRCGGLRKRSGRAAEKGIPWKRPFPQPSLMCSPVASPVVQPAGPLCAARQPADISCFSFGNTALQPARPAGPPFSVILETEVLQHKLSNCQTNAHICCFFACDSKKNSHFPPSERWFALYCVIKFHIAQPTGVADSVAMHIISQIFNCCPKNDRCY